MTLRLIVIGLLLSNLCLGNCDLNNTLERISQAMPLDPDCVSSISTQLNSTVSNRDELSILFNQIKNGSVDLDFKGEYFDFLFRVLLEVNDSDSISTALYYEYGKWLYSAKKDYLDAADAFLTSYNNRFGSVYASDSVFMARCLSNAGLCYYYDGDMKKALEFIRIVVDNKWPLSPRTLANNYQILAGINKLNGNVGLAEEYYYQSGIKLMAISGDSVDLAVYGYNPIGVLYYDFINYDVALKNHIKALRILQRVDERSVQVQSHILDVKSNMANCYTKLERYDEAMDILRNLLLVYQENSNVNDYIRTSLNLSSSLIKQSKISESESIYNKIDSLLKIHPNPGQRRLLTDGRGQLLRHQKHYDRALELRKIQLMECCQITLDELPSIDFLEYDNKTLNDLYGILCYIGVIYRDIYFNEQKNRSGLLDSAFQIYNLAAEILDQIKLGLFDPGFSVDLNLLNTDLLEEVLTLVESQPTWNDRLYPFFERAKSTSLLASIQSSVIESHFENEYPEIKESRMIQKNISELEQVSLNASLTSIKVDTVGHSIIQLKESLARVNQRKQKLMKKGGAINQLYDYEDLKSLQKRMNNQSAVASYFVTRTKIYIMVIEKDKVDLISRKKYPEFDADIRLLTTMKSQELDNKPTWMSANARLSELLWGKELNALPDRIVILPDGILNYLSFEMLFSQPVVEDRPWANLPYVIKSKTISYNFSASIWNEMLGKKTTGSGLLTMAPEFSLGIAAEAESRRGTVPLVFAEQEVGEIRNIWNKTNQRIPKNKSEFIDQSSRASIVHFAGHAFLNDNVAENSYLAFSSDDMVEDKLYIHEIYNMKTPCDLVVLSACNTGQGQLKKGEGVMSLARAFAYSGAKSLIYSLWEVNDGSTRKIMKRFYQELKDGAQKDDALRTAKLAYIDQAVGATQHPFFWASFVAMGDMAPVIEYNFYWLYIGLSLIVLCLVAFILLRRKH